MYRSHVLRRQIAEETVVYQGKYAFVAEDFTDASTLSIYENAKNAAAEKQMYLENVGANLSGTYTLTERLELAIASAPDGIFLEAEDSEACSSLIAKAEAQGIPVITFVSDDSTSGRQSFVGVNYYELGTAYSTILAYSEKLTAEDTEILLLASESLSDFNRSNFVSGVVSGLQNAGVEVDSLAIFTQTVDTSSNFKVEEAVSQLVNAEEAPDIVLCLDELTTLYMYQMLVDYNKVGKIEVLGSYDSETIRQGIEKSVLLGSVFVDPAEVGEKMVEAMTEYRDMGYVSDSITVTVKKLTKGDAYEE